MAILSAAKAPPKRTEPLPSFIESVINDNLGEGIRSWDLDEEWEPYKDDIVANAFDEGWFCKFPVEKGKNLETMVNRIKFTQKQ